MSELSLVMGETATGHLTFDEPTPPTDGTVTSDNPSVATISLDANDHVTWTCTSVAAGTANVSYTGTSVGPDAGPAVVPNMIVTVTAAPVAEHGDFDPGNATIS